MPDISVRTVDGNELRGRYDGSADEFVALLLDQGFAKFMVTYAAQGRDPRDRETIVLADSVVTVSPLG